MDLSYDRCPITLSEICDMEFPVAFHNAPQQPYECAALVEWLSEKQINPMTNLELFWEVTPLECFGPCESCRSPEIVQAFIESTLGTHEKHESMLKYFSNKDRAGWLCVYILLVAVSFNIPEEYTYGFHVAHVFTIIYACAHSAYSSSAQARLVLQSSVATGILGDISIPRLSILTN